MPGGGTSLGFVYFAGAKYLGYSGYAWLINRNQSLRASALPKPNPFLTGLTRTIIGLGVGTTFGFGFWAVASHWNHAEKWALIAFFVGLIPVRIAEWLLLLYLAYRRFALPSSLKWKFVWLGIAVSFLLDLLGLLSAFVLPGGMWIC